MLLPQTSDVVLGVSLDTATQQAAAPRGLYDTYHRPPTAAERASVMQVDVRVFPLLPVCFYAA